MKKIMTIVITVSLTSLFFYLKDENNRENLKLLYNEEVKPLYAKEEKGLEDMPMTLVGQYKVFADSLATIISNKKYDTVFPNGSLGKYAIGDLILKDLGFRPTAKFKREFLKDTLLQEECFKVICMINKYRMRNYIDKYSGTVYNDVLITESGVLAGAHLIGATTLKGWFSDDYNNNEITEVVEKMQGFDLDYIVPVHSYKIEEVDYRLSSN